MISASITPGIIYDVVFNVHPREIFPEGLPPSYVFVATVRLKASSRQLTFDLWRVLSKDKKIQAAVTLNGKDKSVIFITSSAGEKQQRVVFKGGFQVWKEANLHQNQRNLFFEVTHCNR